MRRLQIDDICIIAELPQAVKFIASYDYMYKRNINKSRFSSHISFHFMRIPIQIQPCQSQKQKKRRRREEQIFGSVQDHLLIEEF